jgi:hypothetical protein
MNSTSILTYLPFNNHSFSSNENYRATKASNAEFVSQRVGCRGDFQAAVDYRKGDTPAAKKSAFSGVFGQ